MALNEVHDERLRQSRWGGHRPIPSDEPTPVPFEDAQRGADYLAEMAVASAKYPRERDQLGSGGRRSEAVELPQPVARQALNPRRRRAAKLPVAGTVRNMYVGVYICAGYLQTIYRPLVLCYRRGQNAQDNRGK